jgi:hypothetical protein
MAVIASSEKGSISETDKLSKPTLATTEIKLGGMTLKGTYIIWFMAILSSVSGAIYFAGGEYQAYKDTRNFVQNYKRPDLTPITRLEAQVSAINDRLGVLDNQSKNFEQALTKVNSDLTAVVTIVNNNDVGRLQGSIAALNTSVEGVKVFTRDVQEMRTKMVGIERDMQTLKRDVDSQWNAIDNIGAGALKGK